MAYLFNAWYAASWSHDLTDAPLGRTFLGQRVALYRSPDGAPIALADRCPHRFAPLSRGKLKDGVIECPYHGLRFNAAGVCVLNPQGNKVIPKMARVRTYPLMERYGMVWIWMGDPAAADMSLLPDFSVIADKDTYTVIHSYLRLGVNYQLATDNLLDLSHVEFLHPFIGNPGSSQRTRFEMKQEGNTVFAFNYMSNEPITKLHQLMWTSTSTVGDRRAHMRWDPPSNMLLDVGTTECGRPLSEGPSTPSAHLLTPETETSTHYFWAHGRDRKRDDEELSKLIRASIDSVFHNEDEPMMAACQERMESLQLLSLKPLILSTDAAAVRARRVLEAAIEAEQANAKVTRPKVSRQL